MKDLRDRADVEQLIVAFYRAAFEDSLIGPVFTDVAKLDLNHHLPIMCDFWETVLFNADLYRRNALQAHFVLHARHPLGAEHFDRWLALWSTTLDDLFAGPVAERAKLQAHRIAGSMLRRISGRSGSAFENLTHRENEERANVESITRTHPRV
ncbi:hemoglobin [Herbiconiux ginsengi]|uniref:Hemoglobin n=1 Tax=Herbiconiux ginsengi TaxID=381665 RepID=A0A1H3U4J2_9MICO|nr:hemoglobin [Herbiconiux ginsengi]